MITILPDFGQHSLEELHGNEWRIYEMIARLFLASISKDAIGSETKIDVEMGGEKFTTRGLIIEE